MFVVVVVVVFFFLELLPFFCLITQTVFCVLKILLS